METGIKMCIALILVALSANATRWECGAASTTGFGVGISPNKYTARNIAMYECRLRTSSYDLCFIDYCVPTDFY